MLSNPELLLDGRERSATTIVLAHGAGAGMDTPFMNFFATGLADRGLRVARFEFPYMAKSRETGKKGPPNPPPILRETWLKVIKKLGASGLVIGGKSMGGRIASLVADEAGVAGLVCLGYPFHPVGKPDQLRVEHLQTIKTPTLIIQGERDPFGNREEVAGYKFSPAVRVQWMADGDHNLKPRKSSGRTEHQNWEEALNVSARFVASLAADLGE
jgi:predicted alpha/beta-hydrolase family hydrolase